MWFVPCGAEDPAQAASRRVDSFLCNRKAPVSNAAGVLARALAHGLHVTLIFLAVGWSRSGSNPGFRGQLVWGPGGFE